MHLGSLGVQSDDVVGLCVERSVDAVVGLLGILKSGRPSFPWILNFPKDRLAYMVNDVCPAAILTQKRTEQAIPPSPATRICLDDLPPLRQKGSVSDAGHKVKGAQRIWRTSFIPRVRQVLQRAWRFLIDRC